MKKNINKIFFFFFIFFLYNGKNVFSQQNYGLTLESRAGFLIAHRPEMNHLIQQHAFGIDLGVVLQTNGEKKWHHDFNFPELNLMGFYLSPGNKEILGQTIGLMGGVYLPFYKNNGWSFGTRLDAGLAFISKKYDLKKNPKNNAIGSHINHMVDLAIQIEKQFKRNSIGLGINASHFSNGAVKLPNLGLNIPFINIYYHNYFSDLEFHSSKEISEELNKHNKFNFYTLIFGSTKQIYPTGGRNYGVFGITNFFHWNLKPKATWENGIEVSYNQSIIRYFEGNYPKSKNWQLGVYSAYVLPIHRFKLLVGMGRYLYNPLNPNGMWFHKLGGRFRLTDKIWGNIAIKSHWGKADYFEYGLLYKW